MKCINWIRRRRDSKNLRHLGRILVSIYIIIIHRFLSIDSFLFALLYLLYSNKNIVSKINNSNKLIINNIYYKNCDI